MTRFASFADVKRGAVVTLHRGPLSGEKHERTQAWTASGPYRTASGVEVIDVEIGGAVLAYPLARVSLGWEEPSQPPPAVTIAAVLDPVPSVETRGDRFVALMMIAALAYFIAIGGMAIAGWLLR